MQFISKTTIAISALMLMVSCGNTEETTPATESSATKVDTTVASDSIAHQPTDSTTTIEAAFEITKAGDDVLPKSVISVVINGQSTKIKEISGEAEYYKPSDFAKYEIPEEAIDACGAWYAGQGSYFYLVQSENGVDVYEGWKAEEVSDKKGYHWKKVKSL